MRTSLSYLDIYPFKTNEDNGDFKIYIFACYIKVTFNGNEDI